MATGQPGAKGFELEEALRAYFLASGYFVVHGLPYRLEGEDVTDVDLWLYERPTGSTRRRILVDVKNKKTPRAAERIIWARGLREALGLDGAFVATTDQRPTARHLAAELGVTLLDGQAIASLTHDKSLKRNDCISTSDFDRAIKTIDEGRRTSDWRLALQDARGSIISNMGVVSANKNIAVFGYFANEVTQAQPDSAQARTATRAAYLLAALALISLDFVLANHTFRSKDERRAAIANSVRYGLAEAYPMVPAVRAAIGLTRKYVQNGASVAKQIEMGFRQDAERIPAEIIADYLLRASQESNIFDLARGLEAAAFSDPLIRFDKLGVELKSALGVFLDFNEVSRSSFAEACEKQAAEIADNDRSMHPAPGPLFRDSPAPIAGDILTPSDENIAERKKPDSP